MESKLLTQTNNVKALNKYIVFKIEEFRYSHNMSGSCAYKTLVEDGKIDSFILEFSQNQEEKLKWINDYAHEIMFDKEKDYLLAKSIIKYTFIELMSEDQEITLPESRDKLYKSLVSDLIDDSSTELFADSSLFVYSQLKHRIKEKAAN